MLKAVEGKCGQAVREEVISYSGYFTGGELSEARRSTLSCLNTSDNLNDKTSSLSFYSFNLCRTRNT